MRANKLLTTHERRFPNEIFTLIIEHLHFDPSSLRNTALVCKDFAILSQQQMFRTVDLTPAKYDTPCSYFTTFLVAPFARLLRDPKTAALTRFVRTVRLEVFDSSEMDDILFIFRSLPSVPELIYEGIPYPQYIQAIGMNMGETLEALWIAKWEVEREDWQSFQYMLASLTVLKLLSLPRDCFEDEPLILPSSLRTLYVGGNASAVKQGLGILYPPMLSTVFLGFQSKYDASGNKLLRMLRPDTRVVLNVGDGRFCETFTPDMIAFTHGLRASKLTLDGSEGPFIIIFIAHFVSHLPESVCEISIDFDAGTPSAVDLVSFREDWTQLDGALTKRYQLGLLKSFGVRCTSRTHRSNGQSFLAGDPIDRTILDDVQTLLPLSDAAGILKVDHAALYFDDYYL
ncbi:hypothetical protein BT96DRAFT_921493 [Gymnopus androsaceus JB14]|uniref:F-box domain-containing protein n=1 Tax=Gymnopus androsaceus JB14 TaxID=1447944 RepID=A0A6A4HHB8_9AGAR|nr:hypothetical protein BT96DRAFT_921493 [Gymnopus androsaceus JB14]